MLIQFYNSYILVKENADNNVMSIVMPDKTGHSCHGFQNGVWKSIACFLV